MFYSLSVPVPDAPALTELLRPGALCWLREGRGLLGFGELARFETTGAERFAQAQAWWRNVVASTEVTASEEPGPRAAGPVAIGSFAFSKKSAHPSALVFPAMVLHQNERGTSFTLNSREPVTQEQAHAELRALLAAPRDPGTGPGSAAGERPRLSVKAGTVSEHEWLGIVGSGISAIAAGEVEKVVLARDITVQSSDPGDSSPEPAFNREQVLAQLAARYPGCWTFGVGNFLGATPEMLIEVHDGVAHARVLAGTVDRETAGDDPEGYVRRELVDSAKQRQEHQLAVSSLTEQLAPFASDMRAPSRPFVLELPNVWHLASDVYAPLAATTPELGSQTPTVLALLEALHPTAAVCGTPRQAAGALIRRIENLERGPYAGPVGWVDAHGNGEWGIGLRSAVMESERQFRLFAGCGIVAESDPAAELAETWAKFRPMLQALQG